MGDSDAPSALRRSEEHTSELQSLTNLVCRLLLEKKKAPHTVEPKGLAALLLCRPLTCSGHSATPACYEAPPQESWFFFFNDRAPPEISPLSHTAPLRI